MKNRVLILLSVIFMITSTFGQSNSKLIKKHKNFSVREYTNSSLYYIVDFNNVIKYDSLKRVFDVCPNLQIIDGNNVCFFVDYNLQKLDSGNSMCISLCGNVSEYELIVNEIKDSFLIEERESNNFDPNSLETSKVIHSISKELADKVWFVNQKSKFKFDENYGVGKLAVINPKTIIYQKGDFCFLLNDSNKTKYDSVKQVGYSLYGYKENRVGVIGITKIKYNKLSPFRGYVATFKFNNGMEGLVDVKGREYYKYDSCKISLPTIFKSCGHNDIFNFAYNCLPDSFHFKLYNRWGNLVFETKDVTKQWDGTVLNKNKGSVLLQEGVYVYVLEAVFFNSTKYQKYGHFYIFN